MIEIGTRRRDAIQDKTTSYTGLEKKLSGFKPPISLYQVGSSFPIFEFRMNKEAVRD
jgi:hypothetical protein